MRDDVMLRLTDQLMNDSAFRERARADLDGTLKDAGFQLEPAELTAVREFHGNAAVMSDSDLMAAMSDPATRRQFGMS